MLEIKFYWTDPIDPVLIRKSWEIAFKRTLPGNEWLQIWHWRFETNPISEQILAAYVMEHNTVACFYAVSPMTVVLPDGSTIQSGLMNTGFTHPDFQGKGYYLEMNKEMHACLADMGYKCLFGFANGNSHYSYRKYLQWQDLALLTCFRLLEGDSKLKSPSNYPVSSFSRTLTEETISRLGECFVTKNRYHIQRNSQSLKWRLFEHPVNNYGYIVISLESSVLAYAIIKPYMDIEADIMEIFYTSEDLIGLPSILSTIVSCLLGKGYKTINIWSNLFSEEHLILEKIGFKEHIVNTHFGVIELATLKGVNSIQNWHYRYMDSDVY